MVDCYRPSIYQGPSSGKVDTPRDERQKLYSKRWNRTSKLFREYNPWCVACGALAAGTIKDENGREVPLGVVDHIVPHRGDVILFWDQSNWQTLCSTCHNRKSARERQQMGEAAMDASKQTVKRVVVTGPPNSGKTTYVNRYKGPGATVWDADDIVFVMCGAKRHEWPDYMRFVIGAMLDGFVKALEFNTCNETWIIITDAAKAADVARRLGAEVITMGQ